MPNVCSLVNEDRTSGIGRLLQRLRQRRGDTQADVARAIGYQRGTYAGWEGGHILPGRDALTRLAAHFGVPLDLLLTDGEEALDDALLDLMQSEGARKEENGTNSMHIATAAEAAWLLAYRRLPAAEAAAHLKLLRARLATDDSE